MNLSLGSQTLQLITWMLALIAMIMALYILILNARHPVNRHVSLLSALLAVNGLALGALSSADSFEQARFPTQLLAATVYTAIPAAWLAAMALLRPTWAQKRWLWWLGYIAIALPIAATVMDVLLGTHLWYVGLDANTYEGGYISLGKYVSPTLYMPFILIHGFILGLLPLIPALGVLRNQTSPAPMREIARWIVWGTLATAVLQIGFRRWIPAELMLVVVTAVYLVVYVYAFFRHMAIEPQVHRGSLRGRLTALFLSITLPILLISVLLVNAQARALLRRSETNRLGAIAHLMLSTADLEKSPSIQDLQRRLRLAVVEVGRTGVVYLVDGKDRYILHSGMDFTLVGEDEATRDASRQPPVVALRQGRADRLIIFTDAEGVRWWAYATELGVLRQGVVVQQQEVVITQQMQRFLQFSWLVVGLGGAILFVLGALTIYRVFLPIVSLTQTAQAIAAGDLTRVAAVEGEDEIGALARAFNAVTARLNELIGTLEARVAERTQEVERRAEYLAITGGVSQAAASILDVDTLLDRVAHLIAERFGFYHTGIFLLDEAREWAVLRAVSSEGGQRMLARGHRLRVGEQGIVGYVSGSGRARVALDVDEDMVWVKNPDLPETRSEMALPLIVGQEVIGVLDVQSQAAEAFGPEDVATLHILADQIAVAIRNAQLFEESRRALQELRKSYGEEVRVGWAWRPSPVVGYRYTPLELTPITSGATLPLLETQTPYVAADNTLIVPLQVGGGETFGALRIRRDVAQPWGTQDIAFVERAAQDVAQALEVARLLEESRRRAAREMQVNEIASLFARALDVDVVLQTAARELGRLSGVAEVAVHLNLPESLVELEAGGGLSTEGLSTD